MEPDRVISLELLRWLTYLRLESTSITSGKGFRLVRTALFSLCAVIRLKETAPGAQVRWDLAQWLAVGVAQWVTAVSVQP
jgi:hypothetical protein